MKFDRNNVVGWVISFLAGVAVTAGGLTMMNRVRPAPIVIVPPEPTSPPAPTPLPKPTAAPGPIRVYVNGQVAAAAVYELPPGSIVEQAIEAAGGMTEDANTAVVNLAQPLTDGAQVYVPAQDEDVAQPVTVVTNPSPPKTTSESATSTNADGLININTATLDELDALPGIGPSTAQKIVNHRDENGPFDTIEGIMDVSGIGEAKFAQIKDLIAIDRE